MLFRVANFKSIWRQNESELERIYGSFLHLWIPCWRRIIFCVENSTLIIHFWTQNKVGFMRSSWILISNEKCIEVNLVDVVVLNLHLTMSDKMTTPPQTFNLCYFATAHMASSAANMDHEWIGGCYIHKFLPLELSCPVTSRAAYKPTNKTCF